MTSKIFHRGLFLALFLVPFLMALPHAAQAAGPATAKAVTNAVGKAAGSHPKTHKQSAATFAKPVTGTASWYGGHHVGRKTASGEIFTRHLRTAAHRSLPLGSVVRVVNLATAQSVVVRINDRGPYVKGRMIDLSEAAARDIGLEKRGLLKVRIELISLPS